VNSELYSRFPMSSVAKSGGVSSAVSFVNKCRRVVVSAADVVEVASEDVGDLGRVVNDAVFCGDGVNGVVGG